jgi:hypothetical protein
MWRMRLACYRFSKTRAGEPWSRQCCRIWIVSPARHPRAGSRTGQTHEPSDGDPGLFLL